MVPRNSFSSNCRQSRNSSLVPSIAGVLLGAILLPGAAILSAVSDAHAAPKEAIDEVLEADDEAEAPADAVPEIDISDQLDSPGAKKDAAKPAKPSSGRLDPDKDVINNDEWLGGVAGNPNPDSPEQAAAKKAAETIFKDHYRTASDSVLGDYVVSPVITRNTFTAAGARKTVVVSALDVRQTLLDWIKEEQKKKKNEIQFSMPTYRMENKKVRVNFIKTQMRPYVVTEVSLLIGQGQGGAWKIEEDTWTVVTKNEDTKK